MNLNRPEPVPPQGLSPIDNSITTPQVVERLTNGEQLQVTDNWGTALAIVAHLRKANPPPDEAAPFAERRESHRRFKALSERLLVGINKHQVALADGPRIGFLQELYPATPFLLPVTQVVELQRAWKTYKEGRPFPVLGHKLHPYYGTYAPTRTAHLELFATWLSTYKGPRQNAIDVGTGCGVLALLLSKAGFSHVLATDTNPNAIKSLQRELKRLGGHPAIEPHHGDLLGHAPQQSELVVFNPPWVPGQVQDPLEQALYYPPGLFNRFFDQAAQRVRSGGRVVVVFSNIIELVQPEAEHPIKAELGRDRFVLAQHLTRKVKPNKGRRTRERVEVWELQRE